MNSLKEIVKHITTVVLSTISTGVITLLLLAAREHLKNKAIIIPDSPLFLAAVIYFCHILLSLYHHTLWSIACLNCTALSVLAFYMLADRVIQLGIIPITMLCILGLWYSHQPDKERGLEHV